MVPNATDPKLVRIGLELTLEPFEPFHLEMLFVFFCGTKMERSQRRMNMKMSNDSLFALLFHAPNTEENWIYVIE